MISCLLPINMSWQPAPLPVSVKVFCCLPMLVSVPLNKETNFLYFMSTFPQLPQNSDSTTKQIPSVAELQQSLSSLQVQTSPESAIMHSLPLSPPEDPQALQATTASLSPLHEGSLLPNPPVSPSAVLPTPPPSSESSPMMSTSGKTGANHVSSVENTEEKGSLVLA